MCRSIGATLLAAMLVAAPATAATPDPDDDFIATYVGPPNQELDLRSVEVRLDGDVFRLSATVDAAIGQASNSYFVWGIDRGAGRPQPGLGIRPDLNFDAIFIAYADGTAEYALLQPQQMPDFTPLAGLVQIDGNSLSASLPPELVRLPSTGFAPADYRFTAWTHYAPPGPVGPPSNAQIADFSSTVRVTVPEPATWAAMIAGFALVGAAQRRRRPHAARC